MTEKMEAEAPSITEESEPEDSTLESTPTTPEPNQEIEQILSRELIERMHLMEVPREISLPILLREEMMLQFTEKGIPYSMALLAIAAYAFSGLPDLGTMVSGHLMGTAGMERFVRHDPLGTHNQAPAVIVPGQKRSQPDPPKPKVRAAIPPPQGSVMKELGLKRRNER